MDFDASFKLLIGHEGAFQNDPKDKGNWTGGSVGQGKCVGTKFGISAMSYPGEDIFNLTLDRAKGIYRRDYWGPAGCDAVPDAIKFDLFDMAVNSGVKAAVRTLQRAAGMPDGAVDGILGARTLQAIQAMNLVRVVARFNGARLAFMADLSNWPAFSRGWAKRIASNLLEA